GLATLATGASPSCSCARSVLVVGTDDGGIGPLTGRLSSFFLTRTTMKRTPRRMRITRIPMRARLVMLGSWNDSDETFLRDRRDERAAFRVDEAARESTRVRRRRRVL